MTKDKRNEYRKNIEELGASARDPDVRCEMQPYAFMQLLDHADQMDEEIELVSDQRDSLVERVEELEKQHKKEKRDMNYTGKIETEVAVGENEKKLELVYGGDVLIVRLDGKEIFTGDWPNHLRGVFLEALQRFPEE